MNEHNPPVVLPNGAIYSQSAVEDLARDGRFMCPRSGAHLSLWTCERMDFGTSNIFPAARTVRLELRTCLTDLVFLIAGFTCDVQAVKRAYIS